MGDNASEIGKTIRALRELGRFERVDAARLQAVRSMARALDYDPSNAALWKQYREAVKELTADGGGAADEELAGLFAAVRDAPPS